jgi:uroporphyrinogen-III synthase
MDGKLGGARVALFEARMQSQLAELVRRNGGVPRVAPALAEAPVDQDDKVAALIDALVMREIRFVIFLTGVGAAALFAAAERLGRLHELVAALHTTTNICRSQKPWKPLKDRGVPITITAAEPYTTVEVIEALRPLALEGAGVALIHYGESNDLLATEVARRARELFQLQLYEWRLPADVSPVREIIDEIIRGEVDAVAFTSQVQIRHLLQIATEMGKHDALIEALNSPRLAVTVVGPTCAGTLRADGIKVDVEPRHPKMGPMLLALADHLASTGFQPRPL